ncbi:MAG TPA: SPOR domain-containing protein [Thermoanaerobaculia bacterium]|nr:SPOR domain-containing protein [Thermoanaerobaculia bacterium]
MIGADTEVSNSHEPSYYEIALTNRQVVVAFVILLVCLLSAFFSGVWLGRESTMRAQEQLAQAAVTAKEEPKDGQALEEFEFFGDAQRPAQSQPEPEPAQPTPAQPTPPAPAPADSTLLEDFGGDAGDLEGEPPSDLADVRSDERVVMPTEDERRRARRAEMEALAPAPRQPERQSERRAEREEPARTRPEAAPAASTSASPAPARGGAVIQVFSSPEKDQAERIRDRLVRGGHQAFLSPVEVAGRTMYRVRIGPFDSRGKADEVAGQVRKGFKLDTWVTQ